MGVHYIRAPGVTAVHELGPILTLMIERRTYCENDEVVK
jgi:hypothetical protein